MVCTFDKNIKAKKNYAEQGNKNRAERIIIRHGLDFCIKVILLKTSLKKVCLKCEEVSLSAGTKFLPTA